MPTTSTSSGDKRRYFLVAIAAVLALASASCARAKSPAEDASRVQPAYDKATGRLTQLASDLDGDGKHDAWAYMDGARLIRYEADENGDGRVDRWEHYPAGGGALRQAPERIERATRFDGRISRREFFERGALVRVEEDTDGNGVLDKWETYADGALAILALDSTGRGSPDRRLIYKADGSLDRVEVDPEGSGRFQPRKP